MGTSKRNGFWNRRKGDFNKSDEELSNDYMAGDPGEHNELVERIQHRLGVSREEAGRIVRNSELM